jgi:hypothetical protein
MKTMVKIKPNQEKEKQIEHLLDAAIARARRDKDLSGYSNEEIRYEIITQLLDAGVCRRIDGETVIDSRVIDNKQLYQSTIADIKSDLN